MEWRIATPEQMELCFVCQMKRNCGFTSRLKLNSITCLLCWAAKDWTNTRPIKVWSWPLWSTRKGVKSIKLKLSKETTTKSSSVLIASNHSVLTITRDRQWLRYPSLGRQRIRWKWSFAQRMSTVSASLVVRQNNRFIRTDWSVRDRLSYLHAKTTSIWNLRAVRKWFAGHSHSGSNPSLDVCPTPRVVIRRPTAMILTLKSSTKISTLLTEH